MKEAIKVHIKENLKEYSILLLILIIGISIGILVLNYTSDSGKAEITEYINSFCIEIKERKNSIF